MKNRVKLHYHKGKPIRDVINILKYARIILIIDENGDLCEKLENDKYLLNIIAVIDLCGRLLLEVGIGATRPYHSSCLKREQRLWIQNRIKSGVLKSESLVLLPSLIFDIIEGLAALKISNWKNQKWTINKKYNYYSRKQKNFYQKFLPGLECTSGARFSISKSDQWLLQIIYCLELFSNPIIQNKLNGLARFINLCLGGKCEYKKRRYTKKEIKNMADSKGGRISAIADSLLKEFLLPHHYWFLISQNVVRKKNLFRQIIESLDFVSSEELEREEIEEPVRISNFCKMKTKMEKEMIIRTQLKTNLNTRNDFVVFEVAIPELINKLREEKENNEEPF